MKGLVTCYSRALCLDRPQSDVTTRYGVGYTKLVRPSTSYTNGIKRKLMREQGIDFDQHAAEYELDHIVPLAHGGHPRSIHNFRLQYWEGGGVKAKDKLEV